MRGREASEKNLIDSPSGIIGCAALEAAPNAARANAFGCGWSFGGCIAGLLRCSVGFQPSFNSLMNGAILGSAEALGRRSPINIHSQTFHNIPRASGAAGLISTWKPPVSRAWTNKQRCASTIIQSPINGEGRAIFIVALPYILGISNLLLQSARISRRADQRANIRHQNTRLRIT